MPPWAWRPRARRLTGVIPWYGLILCALLILGWQSVASPPSAQAAGSAWAIDGSRGIGIAEAFVRNSPTFRFDGLEDSLRLEAFRPMASCPGCYEYTIYFESGHPGFGDRSGQGTTAALTPHRGTIVLRDQKVVSGVLDNTWDMTSQRILDFE
jgi:hypothetical protein